MVEPEDENQINPEQEKVSQNDLEIGEQSGEKDIQSKDEKEGKKSEKSKKSSDKDKKTDKKNPKESPKKRREKTPVDLDKIVIKKIDKRRDEKTANDKDLGKFICLLYYKTAFYLLLIQWSRPPTISSGDWWNSERHFQGCR